MTAVLIPPSPPPAAPPAGPAAAQPAAIPTAADWLRALGDVPLHRILVHPPPGTATADDVIRLSHHENRGVELVNGTLVEKPVGLRESAIGSNVVILLGGHVKARQLGIVSGEQGMIRMLMGNVRMPDVAYFRREDLAGGRLPDEAAPRLAPALAVEVLSPTNTPAEMQIKLREYFENGVKVVWVLDPPSETVRVHDAADRFRQLARDDALDGGELLPGFAVRVGDLFAL